MPSELVSLSAVSLGLVPVVIAFTQIFKMWVVDIRYVPLVSMGTGIILAFAVPEPTFMLTVLQGILIGLMASGLFTGARTTFAPAK